jgi:hypothetical protein
MQSFASAVDWFITAGFLAERFASGLAGLSHSVFASNTHFLAVSLLLVQSVAGTECIYILF